MCGIVETRDSKDPLDEHDTLCQNGSRLTSGMAECFYDRVLVDPELAPFFEGIDVEKLREHLADFLTVLTGGPNL